MYRWRLLTSKSGKPGFVPDLAQTLESVSGGEPDRHARVESAHCPEKLIGSILIIREDLRINEELSDVAAFSAGPSPHEDCLAEDVFFMT